ncbi:hypothetical protein [Methanothrix sp.]|uniref:hypothetical protein n=1 Tax=Methanothrix sp. TaxID=90426 RepID=UPI0025EB349C|nr:hypothetical protein [Methanothrix sp.]
MKGIQSTGPALLMLAILILAPAFAEPAPNTIKIVCTTSVLMDPATYIGGDRVRSDNDCRSHTLPPSARGHHPQQNPAQYGFHPGC